MLLEINDENIAFIIKQTRESSDLRQVELGDRAGYSASTICKYETGKQIPKIKDLCNLLHEANCQVTIAVKTPVYSRYRKDIIDYEIVCLGDFEIEISELEI